MLRNNNQVKFWSKESACAELRRPPSTWRPIYTHIGYKLRVLFLGYNGPLTEDWLNWNFKDASNADKFAR